MKRKYSVNCLLVFALAAGTHLSAVQPSSLSPLRPVFVLAADESKQNEGPPEAVIRKLAAMMPEQTFKRGEKTTSKGGAAPEGTAIYPVQILNADAPLLSTPTSFWKPTENGRSSIISAMSP